MSRAVPRKIFFGWYVVAASLVMLFFTSGAQYALGVMFKPIIREFGWSRSSVSFVFLVNMFVFAMALTIVGKLYDRFGPKWIVLTSTLFISVGFVLTSFIHSFGQFFFSYGLIAAAGPAGTGVPLVSTVVSKWFEKWRGLALSLSIAGSSLGAFVLVPLLSLAAASYGWRYSFFYLGLTIFFVNMLIASFVIKGDPRQLGISPFGAGEDGGKGANPNGVRHERETLRSMGLRDAARTRSFWLFLITMFICGSGDFFATTHFINIATDYGVSSFTAGKMMGWYGLMSLAGMLLAGPAADRIGSRIPIVATFLLRFLLYLFIFRFKNVPSLYAFALLFGFTHLVTAPLAPMLMGRLYGFGHIGILTGVVNTVHFLGGGFWPYVTGLIFDSTGDYQLAFMLSAAISLAAVICSFFIVERRRGADRMV
jgi:MFS family permease